MNSNLICIILALCLTSSFATRYTFSNAQGGSWQTAANWSPAGVPGSQDDAVFDYIDNMPNEVTITIDGDVTVNSFTVTHYSYFFRSGSLTVQNDCLLNAGTYTKINITLNGDSKFESTGSGNYVTCDSCVVNIKKSLQMLTITSGYAYIQNSAMFVNFAGATFTIAYGSIGSSLVQAGTIINYGTLIFRTYLMTYPKTPFGDPPVAETGPWSELQNYGDIQIEVNNSTIGVPVYNDIKTWNFNSGKITLRMVQDSTANTERRVFDPNYEYNDAISSGGAHNYYEANINGDVHIIFDQAQVVAGEADRPFNPKAGDFFPVFANFHKYSGRFNSISAEGLPSGLSLGRKNFFDDSTSLYHYGVIICKSDDTVCVNAYSSANVLEMGLAVLFALVAVLFSLLRNSQMCRHYQSLMGRFGCIC